MCDIEYDEFEFDRKVRKLEQDLSVPLKRIIYTYIIKELKKNNICVDICDFSLKDEYFCHISGKDIYNNNNISILDILCYISKYIFVSIKQYDIGYDIYISIYKSYLNSEVYKKIEGYLNKDICYSGLYNKTYNRNIIICSFIDYLKSSFDIYESIRINKFVYIYNNLEEFEYMLMPVDVISNNKNICNFINPLECLIICNNVEYVSFVKETLDNFNEYFSYKYKETCFLSTKYYFTLYFNDNKLDCLHALVKMYGF